MPTNSGLKNCCYYKSSILQAKKILEPSCARKETVVRDAFIASQSVARKFMHLKSSGQQTD